MTPTSKPSDAKLFRGRSSKSSRQKGKTNRTVSYDTLEPRQLMAGLVINEFVASNATGFRNEHGGRSDWIEIFNAGNQTENLAGYSLTDNPNDPSRFVLPDRELAAGEYLVIFGGDDAFPGVGGPFIYTGFGLASSGEYIGLYDPSGAVVSEFAEGGQNYPEQFTDVSYGFINDGTFSEPSYFATPTPGAANFGSIDPVSEQVTASVTRGFFAAPFDVTLSTPTPGLEIRYTTDGSVPTATNGFTYTGPININGTTNLRTVAVGTGVIPNDVQTHSYIFTSDVLTQSANPDGFQQPTTRFVDYEVDPEIAADPLYTDRLLAGLQDIPTVSLTSDVEDIFGNSGIYSNPTNASLEVATSVEYILPDGETGFQIDAGLRIAGGASRNPGTSPKQSFTVRFREIYGAGRLNYELFEDSPVDSFNSLQLRAVFNNSYINSNGGQRERATLIRDQFIRDSLLAFGQEDAGRGEFTNLYINGLYWGVYNLHERADSAHYAEYNGGDPDEIDAINAGRAVDGNLFSYQALQAAAANGTWQEVQDRLDVDNFIDWTIIQQYSGNVDIFPGNNWRAGGGGSADARWRFYAWDSERTLENPGNTLPGNTVDASEILDLLIDRFPEFVERFEDRVQLHYFNGGALTEEALADRWNARVAELDLAIIGETARWGDYRRDVTNNNGAELYTRDIHWVAENQRLLTEFFPVRSDLVISRYQDLGLFPNVDAPTFAVDGTAANGGNFDIGSSLTLSASAGTIIYTTDGTDPRLADGSINPNANQFDTGVNTTTLIGAGSVWRFEDSGVDLGTAWRNSNFDDSAWEAGFAELGYGDGNELTEVGFVQGANGRNITTYFRRQFTATGDYDSVTLSLQRDDGAVVYINGVEVVRDNLPGGLISYNTPASSVIGGAGESSFTDFTIPASLLVEGNNTIAVEIHQVSGTSSDISFAAELTAERQVATPAFLLNTTTTISTRTLSPGLTWSALRSATFFAVAQQLAPVSDLRISEINYNPAEPTAAEIAAGFEDNDDFEFIELFNSSTTGAINLNGVQLADGVTFDFGDIQLQPGERAVVVEDIDAFMERYGTSATVLGQWSGGLSNSGEEITLLDGDLNEILSINYGDGDPWPGLADGDGFSLVLNDPVGTPVEELGKYYSWRASGEFGGTPGTASASPIGVVINEVLANTDGLQSDSIELFNPTGQDIDVSGWFLSDSVSLPFKFQIPVGTTIAAGGYLVYDESDFNPNPSNPGVFDFALSSGGDDVVLSRPAVSAGATVVVEDSVSFGATFEGESLGRSPDGIGRLTRLASTSFGSANGDAEVGPLVISEVNYHPEDPSAAALAIDPLLTDNDLEYIEIANPTSAAIDLTDWRVRGEADYDFVAGTSLAAGEAIVLVSFDPLLPVNANKLAAFEAHYNIGSGVTIVGGLSESLSNSSGRISLQQPDSPDSLGEIPHVVVDEVVYDDLAPWADADGSGQVLERDDFSANGNFASSWVAAAPTPGVFGDGFLLGDANQDGVVDFSDIPSFISVLQAGDFLDEADVNRDGVVDFSDISFFVDLLRDQ